MATSSRMLNIRGQADARKALRELTPAIRRQALRPALAAGGRVIRDAARQRAPVLKTSTFAGASALQRGVRKVGTLRKAISVRTSRFFSKRGDVGVFVNVRPLKNGRGAKNPNDPYYWRWQEFGWKPATGSRTRGKARRVVNRRGSGASKAGAAFLRFAATKLPQALQAFEQAAGPAIQRFQNKGTR